MRPQTRPIQKLTDEQLARFWSYVVKTDYCWQWNGPKKLSKGRYVYGTFYANGILSPHRFSLSLVAGERIDLDVDHKCKNTLCVNPDHLEWVTHAENKRRDQRTHCRRGHPLTKRQCLECNRLRVAAWVAAHRERFNAICRASYARNGREGRKA